MAAAIAATVACWGREERSAGQETSADAARAVPQECASRTARLMAARDQVAHARWSREEARLFALRYGARTSRPGHGTEEWLGGEYPGLLQLPMVERGWREADRETRQLVIKANGVIHFPAPGPYIGRDITGPTYPAPDRGSDLQKALRRELERGMPLVIAADASAPAQLVRRIVEVVPRGSSVRLAVRKSASALVADHVKRFPWTPSWLVPVLEKALRQQTTPFLLGTPIMTGALARAGGGCPGAMDPFRLMSKGRTWNEGIPALVEAAKACQCRKIDIEAIASINLFQTVLRVDNAYVLLPAPSAGGSAFDVAAAGTVGDLAAALTRERR